MLKASAVALLRNDLGKAVHTIMPRTLEATAIYLLSALFFFSGKSRPSMTPVFSLSSFLYMKIFIHHIIVIAVVIK